MVELQRERQGGGRERGVGERGGALLDLFQVAAYRVGDVGATAVFERLDEELRRDSDWEFDQGAAVERTEDADEPSTEFAEGDRLLHGRRRPPFPRRPRGGLTLRLLRRARRCRHSALGGLRRGHGSPPVRAERARDPASAPASRSAVAALMLWTRVLAPVEIVMT